jgi:hypothetical protein
MEKVREKSWRLDMTIHSYFRRSLGMYSFVEVKERKEDRFRSGLATHLCGMVTYLFFLISYFRSALQLGSRHSSPSSFITLSYLYFYFCNLMA